MPTSRRQILIGAAGLAGIAAVSSVLRSGYFARFSFEEMKSPTGFRRLDAGRVTAAYDPFIGIGAKDNAPAPLFGEDLCVALFQSNGKGVRVASFSDYFCPYCRVLTTELQDIERDGLATVTWHELPLLGDASKVAARAALAAGQQGQYEAFHTRLMRARFQPTPEYLAALAEGLTLDASAFFDAMESPQITAQLRQTEAVATSFGILGTPALVVGRTLVIGAIPTAQLRSLIALEAEELLVC